MSVAGSSKTHKHGAQEPHCQPTRDLLHPHRCPVYQTWPAVRSSKAVLEHHKWRALLYASCWSIWHQPGTSSGLILQGCCGQGKLSAIETCEQQH